MELSVVDAFVRDRQPFTGNPAAVCLLRGAHWPADAWMQALAEEMNLSETAFVRPTAEPDLFGLRWFTPKDEVQLCGHATLAAAHALAEAGRIGGRVRFDLKWHGEIGVDAAAGGGWTLGFPAQACGEAEPPEGLIDAMKLQRGEVRWIGFGPYDWVIELADAAAVEAVAPAFEALAGFDCRGVAVCAADGTDGYACRFFAPALRIAEDPVTGSLQCVLGPRFAARLGRTSLRARQLSRRGGELRVGVDEAAGRVRIGGNALTIWRGELAALARP
ncbi:PhzF family phenazine biosynthesis protein [Phycisphaera mikurensis]|uniref:Phenazine biosynthesis protein n=1 Tax=Phycisphaera mikurensis (strain NBRC 102666 / KCTC 22515 / FYK2301M01) TaxID=1142394 RepID=I0IEB6_PHYMF|nr:PhzF family phenazine biosynthesis protein [Phycisphaera mikurensis]MBB6441405.1 PhzF family phenazine biosynthesis protein [Phycisphaera mikurensis]BAM03604.1 hypothetical protein PSMK_14450 [Phycisphaera mikurensis NBRC 102666]